ncbi:MAG: hypothetical protein LBL81_02870, partial [Tannerella sp.]|nr:hypothetical protein [Tannerella sp.]
MKLRTLLVGGITSLLLVGCHRPQVITDVQVVAKVNDRSLTRKEVLSILPKKVSSADSLLMCENYIKNWVKDALIYDLALRNLDDNEKAEIDKLVDDYRHSLVRYRYQERLIKERLSANLRESDKINFY